MYFLIVIRVDVSDKKCLGPVPTSLFVPAALVIIARFCALAVLKDHIRDGGNSKNLGWQVVIRRAAPTLPLPPPFSDLPKSGYAPPGSLLPPSLHTGCFNLICVQRS